MNKDPFSDEETNEPKFKLGSYQGDRENNKLNLKQHQALKKALLNKKKQHKADFDLILKNDPLYIMERHVIKKYSRKMLVGGLLIGILTPPYIMWWKKQQMKVISQKKFSILLSFLQNFELF